MIGNLDGSVSERTETIATVNVDSGRIEASLLNVPGLQQFRRSDARTANPTSQGITMRGLGGNASSRALLFLDDVPQADPFGGWVSWPGYDALNLASIRVRKGVVLSAGGFTYNRTMMAKTAPDYLASHPLGTIADDGSGIKLGMSVGAKTDSLERISAWKFLYPPESFTKSVSIDAQARRLVNEEFYGARTGEALFGNAGGRGWLILDQPLWSDVVHEMHTAKKMFFQKVQYRAIENDYTTSADSIGELAEKIGVPAAQLDARVQLHRPHEARLDLVLLQVHHRRHLVVRLGQQVELVRELIAEEDLADLPLDAARADRVAAAETVEDLERALGVADRARADADRVVVVDEDEVDALLRQVDRRREPEARRSAPYR